MFHVKPEPTQRIATSEVQGAWAVRPCRYGRGARCHQMVSVRLSPAGLHSTPGIPYRTLLLRRDGTPKQQQRYGHERPGRHDVTAAHRCYEDAAQVD